MREGLECPAKTASGPLQDFKQWSCMTTDTPWQCNFGYSVKDGTLLKMTCVAIVRPVNY